MKLFLHLFLCWFAGWVLMILTLGVAGSILERKELMEITDGSGLGVYLFWVGILSAFIVLQHVLKKDWK